MSLKPYPEYKDSGFDWLGSLPSSWKALRLKFGFDLQKRPISSDMEIVTAFRDGEVTLRKNRRLEGYTEGDKQIGYQGIEPGDLVIHAMDAFAGAIGVSDSRGKSTPVYNVCRPKPGVQARFFAFALRHLALTGYIESLSKGIRERSTDFRWADAKNVIVPFPPQSEQHEIVAFLDDELSDIDAFIADQEELITLLAERRTATIAVAVTQGLNPNASMRASSIKWLDRFPEHWTLSKLKHLGYIKYGLGEPPSYVEEGVPLIRATNVSQGKVTSENLARVNPEDIPQSRILWLRTRDIIVVRSGALTGDSATITSEYEGSIAGFDMVFRAGYSANPEYIQYSLLAPYVKSAQIDQVRIRAAQPHLNSKELGDCSIAIPPKTEQDEIVAYLDRETAEIDAAIGDAREAIALSKERRAAVISAAVTGKIDVRGLVAPEANNVEGVSVGIA